MLLEKLLQVNVDVQSVDRAMLLMLQHSCCMLPWTVLRLYTKTAHCHAADLIYTATDSNLGEARVPWTQYFWEAFPAGSGPTDRTTYMFAYMDADSRRCDATLHIRHVHIQGKHEPAVSEHRVPVPQMCHRLVVLSNGQAISSLPQTDRMTYMFASMDADPQRRDA